MVIFEGGITMGEYKWLKTGPQKIMATFEVGGFTVLEIHSGQLESFKTVR